MQSSLYQCAAAADDDDDDDDDDDSDTVISDVLRGVHDDADVIW